MLPSLTLLSTTSLIFIDIEERSGNVVQWWGYTTNKLLVTRFIKSVRDLRRLCMVC